jgi:hypothetical protein
VCTRVKSASARAYSPLSKRLVPIRVQFIRLRHRKRARSGVSTSGGRLTNLLTRRDSSPLLSTSAADPSEGNQALSYASTSLTFEAASKWNSPLTRFSKMAVPLPNSLT